MNALIETRFKIEEMIQAADLLLEDTKNIAEDVNFSCTQDKGNNRQLKDLYLNCCAARALLVKYSLYLDSIKTRLARLED